MVKNSSNKFYEAVQWCILIALFLSAGYYRGQSEFLAQKYQEYVKGNTYVVKYQSDQIIKLKAENIKLYKQIADNEIDKTILNLDDKYFNSINKNSQTFSTDEMSDVTYAQNFSQ
jgi:hypothetical protein